MTTALPAKIKRDVGFEIAALTAAGLQYPERLAERRQAVLRSLTEGVSDLPGWVGVAIFDLCEDGGYWDYVTDGPVAFQPTGDGGGARFAFVLDTLISGVGTYRRTAGETNYQQVCEYFRTWKYNLDQSFPAL